MLRGSTRFWDFLSGNGFGKRGWQRQGAQLIACGGKRAKSAIDSVRAVDRAYVVEDLGKQRNSEHAVTSFQQVDMTRILLRRMVVSKGKP